MDILVITDTKQVPGPEISSEWDKIIIDKTVPIEEETHEFLTTRLNRQNSAAEIIIDYITLQ